MHDVHQDQCIWRNIVGHFLLLAVNNLTLPCTQLLLRLLYFLHQSNTRYIGCVLNTDLVVAPFRGNIESNINHYYHNFFLIAQTPDRDFLSSPASRWRFSIGENRTSVVVTANRLKNMLMPFLPAQVFRTNGTAALQLASTTEALITPNVQKRMILHHFR